jgi:hypothetical protein
MDLFAVLDLHRNELRNAKIQNLGTDPTGLAAGDAGVIWFNTTSAQYKVWDGTAARLLNLADSVVGTAPIGATIANGVLTLSIAPATGSAPGSMSAANYTLLSSATSSNTANTLVERDASGNFAAGTITGTLTGTASNASALNNQNGAYYLSRANHTGVQLAATISDFDTQVRTSRLDQLSAPTAAVSFNGQRITGVADPTSAQDGATKAYVDSVAAGFDVKASVRVASTGDVAIATGLTNGATIDGITVATGDRVLLKAQADPTQNGVYVVVAAGAASRATDMSTSSGSSSTSVNPGSFVFVEQGTTNAATAWVLVTQGPITVGTSTLTFTQVGGSGAAYSAGSGLSLVGNQFSAVGTANRISVGAGGIDIAATYIGQASITTLGTVTTGTWNASPIAIAYGGTGATTAAGARTALGASGKAAVVLTGTGSATSFTATHNLGTADHTWAVYDGAGNAVGVDLNRGANADTVSISPAPANGVTFTLVAVG